MQTIFKAKGAIVTLSIPEDLQAELAATSQRLQYLINYGWKQSLSDAFAAAKDAAEVEGKCKARFDKIVAGSMSERSGGVGRTTDPVEKEMKRLAAAIVDAAIARKGKKISKEDRATYIANLFARDEEILRADAEANLAKLAEESADAADDLDELFGTLDEQSDD